MLNCLYDRKLETHLIFILLQPFFLETDLMKRIEPTHHNCNDFSNYLLGQMWERITKQYYYDASNV